MRDMAVVYIESVKMGQLGEDPGRQSAEWWSKGVCCTLGRRSGFSVPQVDSSSYALTPFAITPPELCRKRGSDEINEQER